MPLGAGRVHVLKVGHGHASRGRAWVLIGQTRLDNPEGATGASPCPGPPPERSTDELCVLEFLLGGGDLLMRELGSPNWAGPGIRAGIRAGIRDVLDGVGDWIIIRAVFGESLV